MIFIHFSEFMKKLEPLQLRSKEEMQQALKPEQFDKVVKLNIIKKNKLNALQTYKLETKLENMY